MQTGFEVTAAVPKRLLAVEDQPAKETMRGERKITQAPSTDQKKVRRQMARKTADMRGPAGECRLCGGHLDLDAVDHNSSTVHAHCRDCGAEHQLQRADQHGRSAALSFAAFQNLSEPEQKRLEVLAELQDSSSRTAAVLGLVDSAWVPVVNTNPYLAQPGMSAIARRAHSVLDTEEIS